VQVIGTGEAGELLPDAVVDPHSLGPHAGREPGAVPVDRDGGERAQPGERRDAHHRHVEHHASPTGLDDQVVALP
jgi:hypothetical protein